MEQAADPGQRVGELRGQVAFVTGGTRGVGRAVVDALLAAGAEVVTCGRHHPGDGALAPVRGSDGVERTARFVEADVRDPEQGRAAIEGAASEHGRLDLLVNNAGGSPQVPAAEASPRFVTSIVTLNLLAP